MEKCSKCKQSFTVRNKPVDILQCHYCENYYHGSCQNIHDEAVLKFISSGVHSIFNCIDCMSKREFVLKFLSKLEVTDNTYSEQQKLLGDISQQVKNQGKELSKLKKIIEENVSTGIVRKSFADITKGENYNLTANAKQNKTIVKERDKKPTNVKKRDVTNTNESLIVIQHKAGEDNVNVVRQKIEKNFDPLSGPIDSLRITKKNKIIVRCKDQSQFEKTKCDLSNLMGEDFCVDKPKEKRLIIKILNIDDDMLEHQLLGSICAKNSSVEKFIHHMKLIRISDTGEAFIECGNKVVYDELLAMKKLRIKWNICPVLQFVNLGRCYKCQMYGHKQKECTSDVVVCPRCADAHDLKSCPPASRSKVKKCINCVREGRSTSQGHCAWSHDCPTVKDLLKSGMNKQRI